MAEQSKFTGAFASLNKRPKEQAVREEAAIAIAEVDDPPRGKGRPPGKSSNPDFQPTTVLLRKQTKRTANRLLEDNDSGQDLSDLIEQLLGEWINQQS